jgi:phosphatidylglycerol lysyltransferase
MMMPISGRNPRAAAVLARSGNGALRPFLDEPGKRWFFAPDPSGGGLGGLVVFGRAGRVVVALGDPIGEPAPAWAAFDRFLTACEGHGSIPGVYQATEAATVPLEERGFRCVPVGREAIVDLDAFDLAGSRRANLRHTVTRARRGGIRVEWYPDGVPDDALQRFLPGLTAMDRSWRAAAGPELGFTISQFEPASVTRPSAVAIALGPESRPVAVATFRSTGADGGYVLDLMRRLPGGVPGALEHCVATAASELRAAGVPQLSLGLAPLDGLDPNAVGIDERLLARAAAAVAPLYDVAGLAFFKDKFGPRWERRYLAARGPGQVLAAALGLLRLHLAPPGTTVREAALRALDGLLPRVADEG